VPKKLSESELEIYSRQIVLADIGYEGQLKLRDARACLIGMGGLGSLMAFNLVAMGIGYLRIVDRDIVSRSDLHRQYLYDVDAVGLPKVEAALTKLSRLNPSVKIDPIPESLNSINADQIIKGSGVVLDGLDRPEPRYIVNRTCYKHKIPYIFGAAIEAFGNVTTLVPGQSLCLECFMPGLTEDDLPKCGVVGVHPSVLGIITAVQVSEAVRILTVQEPKLINKLLYVDLREMEFQTLNLAAMEDCPVCGTRPKGRPSPIADELFEESCARDGRRNFIISPKQKIEIDVDSLEVTLNKKGYRRKTSGSFGMTFEQSKDVTVSILKSGIMIVQTSPQLEGDLKRDILEIYSSILVGDLGLSSDIVPDV
jgi:adenylyltransferase/sulfurtransferase